MTLQAIWRIVAPTITPETTGGQIQQRIWEVDPSLSPADFWAAHDRLCRLAADRRRIAGQAGSWTEPPAEPATGGATRHTPPRLLGPTDPPPDRGRRVIRKSEPMGG